MFLFYASCCVSWWRIDAIVIALEVYAWSVYPEAKFSRNTHSECHPQLHRLGGARLPKWEDPLPQFGGVWVC